MQKDKIEEYLEFDLEKFEKELAEEQDRAKQKGKLYFVLYSFWNGSFCGYRTGHTLTHPWIIFDHAGREIKWAWQRVFRHYDDRVIWSVDMFLAKMIPVWMEHLKRTKQGIPAHLFDDDCFDENYKPSAEGEKIAIERWNSILDQIAEGFRAYIEMDNLSWNDPRQTDLERKWSKGFDLLKENFGDLWD